MPRAYSLDLRERVLVAAREERVSQAALAQRFRVSETTVYNWLCRARETGSVAAKPHGGGRPSRVDAAGAVLLRELVAARNDQTLDELAAAYHARTRVHLSRTGLWRTLATLELRRKKSP